MEVREEMEDSRWKPLDIVTGGILTAGLAVGLYKFGKRSLHLEPGTPRRFSNQELEAMRLNECVALARLPSEMEFPPQQTQEIKRLTESLQQSVEKALKAAESHNIKAAHRQKQHKPGRMPAAVDITSVCDSFLRRQQQQQQLKQQQRKQEQPTAARACKIKDRDQTSPEYQQKKTSPTRSSAPSGLSQTSPSEQARLMQVYQQRLDKWTAESEAKLEKLEQQKLELSLELRMTSESLERLRNEQAAEDHNRRRTEIQLKEMENKVRRADGIEMKLGAKDVQIKHLEQQVIDLEDQLEKIYAHNVVMSRDAAQKRVEDFEQMQQSLESLQAQLNNSHHDLDDMENNNDNLQIQLNKARRDLRELGVENAKLQKQLLVCQQTVRQLACGFCANRDTDSRNKYSAEYSALADALQQDQPADILLVRLAAALHTVAL